MDRPYVPGRRFVVDELRRLLAEVKASRIVPLDRVRELEALLSKERSRADVERSRNVVAALSKDLFLFHGARLLDWIATECQEPGGGQPQREEQIASKMMERPAFRRMSQVIRRHYAGFTDVKIALVQPHVRKGRKVRGHRRLLGTEHLRDLPVDRYLPIVGRVVRTLISRLGVRV